MVQQAAKRVHEEYNSQEAKDQQQKLNIFKAKKFFKRFFA